MTKEEFKTTVKDLAGKLRKEHPELRKGQAIFNVADHEFGVARICQFDYGVDCFYDDSIIEPFLDKCYEIYHQTFDNNE